MRIDLQQRRARLFCIRNGQYGHPVICITAVGHTAGAGSGQIVITEMQSRAACGVGWTKLRFVTRLLVALGWCAALAQTGPGRIAGIVVDPAGRAIAGARVEIAVSHRQLTAVTDAEGSFDVAAPASRDFTIHVEAAGFAAVIKKFDAKASGDGLTLRLDRVATQTEQVIVSANASEIELDSPDPSQRVMVREELLDANPGRPGAPVSIPGMPIETASGGIKAPQYFVPGVAGDHGEPIAQYIAVGASLVPNNLSANAHGNGYADPNIYISGALDSVGTDGGAFNVLEGNHSLNLAAVYGFRPRLGSFVTLTGDERDLDAAAGFAPADSGKREWLALEANYGNGLLLRPEHRQQYKWNAMRVFAPGRHEISLLSIGYYGTSFEGNLTPIGYGVELGDTIDPRQRDQTHTSILAADDRWNFGDKDRLNSAGYFRTYNLALFSNFGEGLIRQSEFRTVEGGEVRETHTVAPWLQAMVGMGYDEDDIHRDNLDHYLSRNPQTYGPFLKVLANDITIRDAAPYIALRVEAGKHLRLYAGLRHEAIEMKNDDAMKPTGSFDEWRGFENPKATLTWFPGFGDARWLPSASFSMGQSFFTEDPRISVAGALGKGSAVLASPFERAHSEQLVVEKEAHATDIRLTLGQTTTTATLAKIDPDTGLAEDEGSGLLRYLAASVRHRFDFGMVQAVLSKADARDVATGIPTPEAPRTIFDALTALDRLPFGLRGRGEYEYVGHKLLDVGNSQHPAQFEAIPVGETRMALARPFLGGRLELGADGMIARGYTGQTTETFAPGWQIGDLPPACAPGVSGVANDFDCGTVERSVGVRMRSWIGGSISWRFRSERAQKKYP
jgi:hypothetical protein